MSRILQAGETGFGILIEQDAGFIDVEDNKEIIKENFEVKMGEPVQINCVLQKWGVKNKNGRIYPKDVLLKQITEYEDLVKTNSAPSEADHPDSSIVSLLNISHLVKKMWWGKGDKENILYGQIELIVTPGFLKYGIVSIIGDKILLYLKDYKMRLGISSRGVGSLKEVNGENLVQDDFELIAFDLVAIPSTPGAYLYPDPNEFNMSEYKKNEKGIFMNEGKKIKAIDDFLN